MNYSVVVPDVRGFGDSKGAYDKKRVWYDIERVVEYLKGEVVIVGYGFGASVALAYASRKVYGNTRIESMVSNYEKINRNDGMCRDGNGSLNQSREYNNCIKENTKNNDSRKDVCIDDNNKTENNDEDTTMEENNNGNTTIENNNYTTMEDNNENNNNSENNIVINIDKNIVENINIENNENNMEIINIDENNIVINIDETEQCINDDLSNKNTTESDLDENTDSVNIINQQNINHNTSMDESSDIENTTQADVFNDLNIHENVSISNSFKDFEEEKYFSEKLDWKLETSMGVQMLRNEGNVFPKDFDGTIELDLLVDRIHESNNEIETNEIEMSIDESLSKIKVNDKKKKKSTVYPQNTQSMPDPNTYLNHKYILISPYVTEKDILMRSYIFKTLSKVYSLDKHMENMSHDNLLNIQSIPKENVIIFHGTKDSEYLFEDGLRLADERGCKIYRSEIDDYKSILRNAEVIKKIDEFVKNDS